MESAQKLVSSALFRGRHAPAPVAPLSPTTKTPTLDITYRHMLPTIPVPPLTSVGRRIDHITRPLPQPFIENLTPTVPIL